MSDAITVVAAVNDRAILAANLLRSPLLAPGHPHELLVQEGFASAGLAYNDALQRARHDLVVFVHQDVYLPEHWLADLHAAIDRLEAERAPWGVIGCFGTRRGAKLGLGRVWSTGWGLQGEPVARPEPAEALDEIVLVIRQSSGLRFDADLPGWHMYGVDLCLAARHAGRVCYVMPTFCVHNTRQLLDLPPAFFAGYRHVKRKWRQYLPIYSPCIRITRFDGELIRKKLEAAMRVIRRRPAVGATRLADPRIVLEVDA